MGYHLTILRTNGAQQLPIARSAVMAALTALGGRLAPWPAPGGQLQLVDPQAGQASALLVFDDAVGELWSSGPDDSFLALMIALADQLGARVRGDEGETYRSVEQTYAHPDDEPAPPLARAPHPRGTWHWRGWFIGAWTVGMAAILLWKRSGGGA